MSEIVEQIVEQTDEQIVEQTDEQVVEQTDEQVVEKTWPPTDEEIKDIACAGLNQSNKKDVSVLVYWDNPTLMIYNPICYAKTEYVQKKFECGDRSVYVLIGRQD